jgi:hypothetical protein
VDETGAAEPPGRRLVVQTVKTDNGWTVAVLPASEGRVWLGFTGPGGGDKGGALVCITQVHELMVALGWARAEAEQMAEAMRVAEAAQEAA